MWSLCASAVQFRYKGSELAWREGTAAKKDGCGKAGKAKRSLADSRTLTFSDDTES